MTAQATGAESIFWQRHARQPATVNPHAGYTPAQPDLPREDYIKESSPWNGGLLWGEPRTQNLLLADVTTWQERRTAALPQRKGAVAAGVSSTRRPVSPWPGCSPAWPASASPDKTQDATASAVSQIPHSHLSAPSHQTEEVFRDTNGTGSRGNRDDLVKRRLREDARSTVGRLPAHAGLRGLGPRSCTRWEELGTRPVRAGRHVQGDTAASLGRGDLSAEEARPLGSPHRMHRGAFGRPQPVADKNSGQRSGQRGRQESERLRGLRITATLVEPLSSTTAVRNRPQSHAGTP